MRILLVRLSSFGDVVFTMPLARALKSGLPGATLAWVVEEPLAPLVEGAPWVDLVLTATTRRWRRSPFAASTFREIRGFLAGARSFAPDLVVDAQGLLKSALITLAVRAGRKVGFGRRTAVERVNCLVTDEHVDCDRPHAIDRGLALAEHVTGRTGFSRRPDVQHLAGRPDAEVDGWWEARQHQPFALLQPFSSRSSKEWPLTIAARFCRRLGGLGLPSVVRWGPGERERAEALAALSQGTASLAPPSSPAASARLASFATLFVGADTGPTHLAAAAGTPTVALFGPTDPAAFGPVGPSVAILRDSGATYNRSDPGLSGLVEEIVLEAATAFLP